MSTPRRTSRGPATFSPAVRGWFDATFDAPTPAQARGWKAIAGGEHTLILAPTGSGKTLAAFLWAIDKLSRARPPEPSRRTQVLYISPLRALAVDVEKNLRAPLAGIQHAAERIGTELAHAPVVGVRTGDTPAAERRALVRRPPDILITTPESLYLMLTSSARETLRNVSTVIVDEIHAVAATKRGAHLALSLERLEQITERPAQRIGLSATQRPLDEIARFLGGFEEDGGPRPVAIVDAGHRKPMELQVVVPVEDMAEPGGSVAEPADADGAHPLQAQDRSSIWPAIHPRLLELIRAHGSTIVFVNARRLAERLASRLNELGGDEEPLVRAHHGALARDQRLEVEDALKSGRLRGIVATSSLELGIDMGAVDLVVQVESPGSVASGLQRIGRAGHRVGEPSRGMLFPKYRGDLLETAVVAERMLAGAIEETRYPRSPLDVLAQQIVAAAAVDHWEVDRLYAMVRRAANFRELSPDVFGSVLDMLAGRYPSDGFAQLRPRIVWDRANDTLRGRDGSGSLAVTSGGTIPDRGLFGVFLPDGTRVGELDEEMVYESRAGEVFLLGASSWRIEDIGRDRVIVSPAPGEPAKMPFWKGDKPGRPLELGRAIGAFTRELRGSRRGAALARLRDDVRLDPWAANNLVAYLDDQLEATGAVPDDRTVVVERFRDELGDWRMCVLSPFGSRVHAPWALVIEARLMDRFGPGAQVLWSDDGIVVRLPEAVERIPADDLLFEPETVEDEVVKVLPGTALFASIFREASARALLLPRRRPGTRTPLWQQRQRSADLLSEAAKHPTFPMLLETTRECVRDVFDVPALREVMSDLRARRTKLVAVDTERASPFAQSLLLRWVAVYMYEGDAPLAERRAAALALDRDLLRELLGTEELRELLDPRALDDVELELQWLAEGRRARRLDSVHDLLRTVGDLRADEVAARCDPAVRGGVEGWIARLVEEGRAIHVRIAGEDRVAAGEDAGRLRDALGVALPIGLPVAFTGPTERPLEALVARFARTHGPFVAEDAGGRLGVSADRVRAALETLQGEGRIAHGEFRPGGTQREWCDEGVLRRIRRRSLAALRKEIEPVDAAAFGRFLTAWQGARRPAGGVDALAEALGRLQGAAIPASVLETDVLPARVRGYRGADLDALCASGDVVWVGAGRLGSDDGRVILAFRDQARSLIGPPGEAPEGELHDAIRGHLAARGASFWPELVEATGSAAERPLLQALWDLVWSAEVTNDTMVPLRAFVRGASAKVRATRPGSRPRPGSLRRAGPPAAAGRWSLVSPLRLPAPAPTEVAHARARQLLDRHGVVTRESVLAEDVPGGFAGVYPVLKAMEDAGAVRRGYFVAGLGAAQFALPGAVDRLRASREPAPEEPDARALVLAATDPAQPYGAALPWPASGGRPARQAGAYVVLVDGAPAAFLERGARSLVTFGVGAEAWADPLASLVKDGRLRRIELRRIDEEPAGGSGHADRLRDAGFLDGYRGLTLRG